MGTKKYITDVEPAITEREVGSVIEPITKRTRFMLDVESLLKGIVCAALIVFFALLQTTMFTRFHPFGIVPDLMLPLVVAISVTEREKWGAVCGIAAAFVIESLGGATVTILSLLYMPVGYICGILSVVRFRDSIAVRAVYTFASVILREIFTVIILASTAGGVTLLTMFRYAVLPEFAAGLIFAFIPHILTKLVLKPFHRSREEKVRRTAGR